MVRHVVVADERGHLSDERILSLHLDVVVDEPVEGVDGVEGVVCIVLVEIFGLSVEKLILLVQ